MRKSLTILTIIFSLAGFSQESCLIGKWTLDNSYNDVSGNDIHAVNHGADWVQDRHGKANSALYFNGQTDYLDVQFAQVMRNINNEITVCAWVNLEDEYYHTVFDWEYNNGGLLIDFSRYQQFGVRQSDMNYDLNGADEYWSRIVHPDHIPINTWVHIAYTFDNQNEKYSFFFNGTLVHSGWAQGSFPNFNTAGFLFGKRRNTTYPEYLHGRLDDLRVYSCALTRDEIYIVSQDSSISKDTTNPNPNPAMPNSIFNLCPNLITSGTDISVNSIIDLSFGVYNDVGQLINEGSISTGTSHLQTTGLAQGMYFIRFSDGNKIQFTEKFVVY